MKKRIRKFREEPDSVDPLSRYLRRGVIWTVVGLVILLVVIRFDLEKELYILAGGFGLFGILQLLTAALISGHKLNNGLVSIITDLYRMPLTMKQLAIVQFFSWFAMFSMWIYTIPGVTQHLYGTTDTTSELYNEGANLLSGMMGWYNLFAAAFGLLLLPLLVQAYQPENHPFHRTGCGRTGTGFHIDPE